MLHQNFPSTTGTKEPEDSLRNELKKDTTSEPVQAGTSAAPKAEKVRSSRFEWEAKTSENEKSPGGPKASHRSMLQGIRELVKKFFSGGRGFFDNDDDASPSAA
jgi:hypothetical protein